ncbi:MAG TPA: nuclear transport factor 2 family protein [Draconibacterium sp.]|nr:nuclear transport factor 2 family protein [Draconibacterium sp.]
MNALKIFFRKSIKSLSHEFFICGIILLLLQIACNSTNNQAKVYKERAALFFNSVYGGNPSKIDELISDDFISVYPSYLTLFNKPGFCGRKEFEDFALGFNQRWKETKIKFDEITTEENRVALVWTFSGVWSSTVIVNNFETGKEYTWGGITVVHFNKDGNINMELGIEDSPGPYELLQQFDNSN